MLQLQNSKVCHCISTRECEYSQHGQLNVRLLSHGLQRNRWYDILSVPCVASPICTASAGTLQTKLKMSINVY